MLQGPVSEEQQVSISQTFLLRRCMVCLEKALGNSYTFLRVIPHELHQNKNWSHRVDWKRVKGTHETRARLKQTLGPRKKAIDPRF